MIMSALPSSPIPPSPDERPVNGELVLVVDDDAGIRHVASLILTRAGFTVLTADCGEKACSIAKAKPEVRVLLTDLNMPGMTGEELGQWFAAHRADVGIAYMSASLQRLDALKGARIQKPFLRMESLVRTVRAALHQSLLNLHTTN